MSNGKAGVIASFKNPNTITSFITMQREKAIFTGGLCLSKESYANLIAISNDFLHPREKAYFASLTHQKRQYSYLLGRYCAKDAISALTKISNLTTVCIKNGIFEQPIVYCPLNPNLQVSISHTDAIGCAIAFPEAHPMGIDVEIICDSKIESLQEQMTKTEKAEMGAMFNDATQLILRWTVKEALSKVLKCGLMMPFHLLEIKTPLQEKDCTISFFTNFHQYKAMSFIMDNVVCSIVYPIKTQLVLNFHEIKRVFNRSNGF